MTGTIAGAAVLVATLLVTRIWAAAYLMGAATIGAFGHYLPSFDPP